MSEPRPTDLLGVWQLERRLVDRCTGQFGHVTGRLELTLAGTVVHWLERGELDWDGAVYDVSRELQIVAADTSWQVRFPDGRPFHPWAPGRRVEHPCRDDLYCGLIDVNAERTRLRVLWDVTGPAKDQRILTRCAR